MNRRGITALFDAAMFIVLIGIAANIIALTESPQEEKPDVQDPAEVLERVLQARLDPDDIGVDAVSYRMPMNRLAYASLLAGDGCFMDYLEGVLREIYPWTGAYHLTVSCQGITEERGSGGPDVWKSSDKTFQTGYGTEIGMRLEIYR